MKLVSLLAFLAVFGVMLLVVTLPSLVQTSQPFEQFTEKQLVDDDVMLGSNSSPVLFVEFGDFLCEYCTLLHETVEPTLREKYVTTGKLKMVFRDFVSPAHALGIPAAAAATCTNDRYWDMRDLLYQNVYKKDTWSTRTNATDYFAAYAQQLGKPIATCMARSDILQEIEQDTAQGLSLNVMGTPTIFIGNEHKGFIRVLSAQPLSVYEQLIEEFLHD